MKLLVCHEIQAGECVDSEWIDYAASWMTLQDAALIGTAIGALWAVAYGFRLLRVLLEAHIFDKNGSV